VQQRDTRLSLDLAFGDGLELNLQTSGSWPLRLEAAGRHQRLRIPGTPAGLGQRRTALGAWERPPPSGGSVYTLHYETTALQLRGEILDLGDQFATTDGAFAGGSPYDPNTLRAAVGTRTAKVDASWDVARGLTFSSSQTSIHNDRFGDPKRGLTTIDATHSLTLNLGASSRLTASLDQHREHWDPVMRRSGASKSARKVELESKFGRDEANVLRCAMTSVEGGADGNRKLDKKNEVHLSLAPTERVRLNADYLDQRSGPGGGTKTQSVGVALEIAPGAEVSAGIKTLAVDQGVSTRESSLRLTTGLGGGSSSGNMTLEQHVVGKEGAAATTQRKWMLSGALGAGGQKANMTATVEEAREDGDDGKLSRNTALCIDRAFGPRLKLAADFREKVAGTNGQPETALDSKCQVDVQLGEKTELQTALMWGRDTEGVRRAGRSLSVAHQWGSMNLKAEEHLTSHGDDDCSTVSCVVDAQAGELPDWAQGIPGGHQFEDAQEHLVVDDPAWGIGNIAFAGYRLALKQRRGGPDDGTRSYSIAHRRVVAGRYHLQLAHECSPEGKSGPSKGRPQALRRSFIGVGVPLSSALTARGSYSCEASLLTPGDRLSRIGMGVWGRLSEQEQVEVGVHRESGRWDGNIRRRTAVSVLYDLRVSEEHHVSVKAGYAWGEQDSDACEPDCRLTLAYAKPI
jgi:hypothetical protein